jgi:hypothetical protein
MDAFYVRLSDEDLRKAMDRYTEWLDFHFAEASASGPQSGPQAASRHEKRV